MPDAARMRWSRHNHDLDVLTKRVEEAKESVGREAAKSPTHHIRDTRLVNAEEFGRLRLRQPSLLDDRRDPGSDFGLDEQLSTVCKSDVLEDIPAAPLDGDLGPREFGNLGPK